MKTGRAMTTDIPFRMLRTVLVVKIVGTAVFFAISLVLKPEFPLEMLRVRADPLPARLLGWSYLAILVVYISGLLEARRGLFPSTTVIMGLLSNAGASLLLALYVAQSGVASAPVACSALLFTGTITMLLAVCWMQSR